MIIEVTQHHIDNGAARNSSCCAIALAIEETLEKQNSHLKFLSCKLLDGKLLGYFKHKATTKMLEVIMPNQVKKFVEAFDAYKTVNPIKFSLNLNIGE